MKIKHNWPVFNDQMSKPISEWDGVFWISVLGGPLSPCGIVIGLGKNLLFKSGLAHCEFPNPLYDQFWICWFFLVLNE